MSETEQPCTADSPSELSGQKASGTSEPSVQQDCAPTEVTAPSSAAPEQEPQQADVFCEEHFATISYEEAGISKEYYEEFKEWLIGQPIPEQDTPDAKLYELGYKPPQPWIQRCIEVPMLNW